jgi:hypothetical protein
MAEINTPPFLKSYDMTKRRARFLLRLAAIIFPGALQRCTMWNDSDQLIAKGWLHHDSGITFVTFMADLKRLKRDMKVMDKNAA